MMKKFKTIAFFAFTLCMLSSCKKSNDGDVGTSLTSNYENYIDQINKNVSSLSPERKKKREEWMNELKRNQVYIALVDSNNVSEKYLPTLNAISEAIKNTYLENGVSLFGISDEVANDLEKSTDGSAKMDFTVKVALLSMKMNGGMPESIVQVYENYRKKFNLYGKAGDVIVDASGKKIKIEKDYNLSYTFALFNPSDKKVLDAIFESVEKKISQWNEEANITYDNAFMGLKNGYMKHLREVYPDSEYLMDVDFELTPEDLYSNYSANEVAADEKFKGKRLAITGMITDIGKDITDSPYISFRVDDFQAVTCYFDDENVKAISKLKKGEIITVIGKCDGLMLTNVVIRNCEIY